MHKEREREAQSKSRSGKRKSSSEQMEGKGRRKPLADCSNALLNSQQPQSQSSSSSPAAAPAKEKTTNAQVDTHRPLLPPTNNARASSSAAIITGNENNYKGRSASKAKAILVPAHSTPSRPPNSSSLPGTATREESEPRSVYTRRPSAENRRSKGKGIASEPTRPMSCSPLKKTHSAKDKMKGEGVICLSKFWSEPNRKKRRTQPVKDAHQEGLPQDFVEQQRAYFAEIDAFELPEEEVTSADELE